MKRLAAILLLLLTLSGCTMAPDEYLSITPHVDSSSQSGATDAVTVENYLSLKNAILALVRTGQTEGVIHAVNYDGIVEDDLAEAAYEVSKLDPLGAYAVDYMTHSCARIVSYYEIRIDITFRRTAQEIAEIISLSTLGQLQEKLQRAVDSATPRLTLRISSFRDQDQNIPVFVADYCAANPGTVMETPAVSVSVYPESGSVRILEINFTYQNDPETLQNMQKEVQESIGSAAEYIRYRQTDLDKARLLFTYLTERFQYTSGETVTPLYDALCGGIADPTGLAQAWQLICDQAGVECYTVTGMRRGDTHTWNMISAGGYYRHLDLEACVLELGTLTLWDDTKMADYYWNIEMLPSCDPLPEPDVQPEPIDPPTETPTPDDPDHPTAEDPSDETPEPPSTEEPAPEPGT